MKYKSSEYLTQMKTKHLTWGNLAGSLCSSRFVLSKAAQVILDPTLCECILTKSFPLNEGGEGVPLPSREPVQGEAGE